MSGLPLLHKADEPRQQQAGVAHLEAQSAAQVNVLLQGVA
jgi:hypothetical protein